MHLYIWAIVNVFAQLVCLQTLSFSIIFSFLFIGIQSSTAYNDLMLCPLVQKIVSTVKQWNGIKETNTTTGSDKEWQKENKLQKWWEPV